MLESPPRKFITTPLIMLVNVYVGVMGKFGFRFGVTTWKRLGTTGLTKSRVGLKTRDTITIEKKIFISLCERKISWQNIPVSMSNCLDCLTKRCISKRKVSQPMEDRGS
uniref:Uncharacterized protein n=1 Tax=Cacopsylla melanoneura TaxID=428564 RepID=A0A8D8V506_9HEMI